MGNGTSTSERIPISLHEGVTVTKKFNPRIRALMCGMGQSGKTTLLNGMLISDIVNDETYAIKSVANNTTSIVLIDGKERESKDIFDYLGKDRNALIFVIDAATVAATKDSVIAELDYGLTHVAKNVPILVYANKKDIQSSMSASDISKVLKLDSYKNRKWKVQPCCAKRNEGVMEGLLWLDKNLSLA